MKLTTVGFVFQVFPIWQRSAALPNAASSGLSADLHVMEVAEPNGGPAEHGHRTGGDLCFPNVVSKGQEHALKRQLMGLRPIDAQQVLDELAGRMRASQVRDPVRYCAGLVGRLKRGEFQPDLGVTVARYRDVQRQREEAIHEQDIAPGGSATSAAN